MSDPQQPGTGQNQDDSSAPKATATEARQADIVLDSKKKRQKFLIIVAAALIVLVIVYFAAAG